MSLYTNVHCLGNTVLVTQETLISDQNRAIQYGPHFDCIARLQMQHSFERATNFKDTFTHHTKAHSPRGKSMSLGVLHMNNIERTRVAFPIHDCTHTTQITTSGDHAQVSGIKFNEIQDLGRGNLQLDSVVHFNDGVGVTYRVPSWVTKKGMPFGPVWTRLTLHSLY